MAVSTAAGCTISIGTTAATASSDTYVLIGEVVSIGQFGRSYDMINYNALGNRNVIKFKGQRDDGVISLDLGRAKSDAGQTALNTALDDDHDYNFKVILNDASTGMSAAPTNFTFKAKVMSYQTTVGSASNVVSASVSLGITSGTITETASS